MTKSLDLTFKDQVSWNPFRNAIINGNFDIWQRATSQTSSGYGSDDRWNNLHNGSSKTASRQSHTLGQTNVPGNPKYYSRTVVTTSAGSGNYVLKQQRIEDVSSFSGKNVTVTFWAKADSSKNVAIEFVQSFGTTGSPSADVTGIGTQLIALTSSWQKISKVISIPSVSGKTLGTDGNDYLALNIWFDAGSSFNTRTGTLGQQSGTFDISRVSVVEGDARLETDAFTPRFIDMELQMCKRYFQWIKYYMWFYATTAQTQTYGQNLPVAMRNIPSVGSISADPDVSQSSGNNTGNSVSSSGREGVVLSLASSGAGNCYLQGYRFPLSAEL